MVSCRKENSNTSRGDSVVTCHMRPFTHVSTFCSLYSTTPEYYYTAGTSPFMWNFMLEWVILLYYYAQSQVIGSLAARCCCRTQFPGVPVQYYSTRSIGESVFTLSAWNLQSTLSIILHMHIYAKWYSSTPVLQYNCTICEYAYLAKSKNSTVLVDPKIRYIAATKKKTRTIELG